MNAAVTKKTIAKKVYRYIDNNEKRTNLMVMKNKENWDLSEKRILDKFTPLVLEDFLRNNSIDKLPLLSLLDAGSGPEMRLSGYFAPVFGTIAACEPDTLRYWKAMRAKEKNPELRDKAKIYNCGLEDIERHYKRESFNCVVLSHVINHLSCEKGRELIAAAFNMLRQGGFLLIFTAHSQTTKDTFFVDDHGETDKEFYEKSIKLDKFCTHRYSADGLMEELAGAGFEIREWFTFHCLDYPHLEIKLNYSDMKSSFGRDLAVFAQKPYNK